MAPAFVDAHLHLDYANTMGQPRDNVSGTLFEAIDIWRDHKAEGYVNRERVLENALQAVRWEVGLHVGHMLSAAYLDRCLDFITVNGARNLGIAEDYGVEEGRPADLVVLDARDDRDALWHHADVLASVHAGRLVFGRPRRTFARGMDSFLAD